MTANRRQQQQQQQPQSQQQRRRHVYLAAVSGVAVFMASTVLSNQRALRSAAQELLRQQSSSDVMMMPIVPVVDDHHHLHLPHRNGSSNHSSFVDAERRGGGLRRGEEAVSTQQQQKQQQQGCHCEGGGGGEDPPFRSNESYVPSVAEQYLLEHAKELDYLNRNRKRLKPTCRVWTNASMAPPIFDRLSRYRTELATYTQLVQNFSGVADLRRQLRQGRSHEEVCRQVELHEDGLEGLFPDGQLSSAGSFGMIEPLLPPLRHPEFCFNRTGLIDLNFLVHDFGAMCRQLTSHSRIVLVDIGASLVVHKTVDTPAVYLTNLYHKFGLPFDHVYAFEITETKPVEVFENIAPQLMPSYHWINVGVSADPDHLLNPFKLLLDHFTEEDYIVVKLDIDTPSIELPLLRHLFNDTRLHRLVDHFYFEHHAMIREFIKHWSHGATGSFKLSLDLFQRLRRKGVAAHSWV